jgi:hypothetical protein
LVIPASAETSDRGGLVAPSGQAWMERLVPPSCPAKALAAAEARSATAEAGLFCQFVPFFIFLGAIYCNSLQLGANAHPFSAIFHLFFAMVLSP